MSTAYPGKSILIVEDHTFTRESLASILREAGCTVAGAADGREAIELLRRGARPDLILLDLAMPGMDGWQFRREQLQDPVLAGIPVVILSAASDLREQVSFLGVAGALAKPVEFEQLLDTVRALARGRQPGVLVVDDEPQLRRLLEIALGHHGFVVWTAASGEEAVRLYREQRSSIDLAVLDVQMPGRDGPWTLAALREVNADLICCFLSGDIGTYELEDLAELGAAAVYQKPIGLAELAGALQQLLARPSAAP